METENHIYKSLLARLIFRTAIVFFCLFAVDNSASGQAEYITSHKYWGQPGWYGKYIIFENDSLVRFNLPYGYNGFKQQRIWDKGIVSFQGDTLIIRRKFVPLKDLTVYAEESKQPGIGTTIHFRGLDSYDSLLITILEENQTVEKKISIKSCDDSVFLECRQDYKFVFSRVNAPEKTVTINSEYLINKQTTIMLCLGHQVDEGIWKFLVIKKEGGVSLIGPLSSDHKKRNKQRWMSQFIHQWPWKWTKLSREHIYDPMVIELIPSDSVYPFVFEDMEVFERQ